MLAPTLASEAAHDFPPAAAAGARTSEAVPARVRSMLRANLSYRTVHQPLAADMTAYAGRQLRFADLRFSPHFTASPGGAPQPDTRILVSLHKSGDAVVSQGGREHSIQPGSIFVLDPTQPFEIATGTIETRSVYLARSALLALVPQLDALTALPISCSDGPGAILRAAIDAMFDCAASLDDSSADRIADALPHLLAPALLKAAGAQALPSRLRHLHIQQIRRYAREHLGDSTLDPNSIAHAVRLSARHVHELFADEPEPLMKWVWTERLQRCQRDLAEPRLAQRTIGEIAYAWGFSDTSHFSRAFKARFGVAPREFRRSGRSGS
ncbi:MAG TPA: helix-turn-helix domain-containing protein [Ramlibacter sp.]|nr:helix-turn-helix domain-containing protein [Ramlibacter sp.]